MFALLNSIISYFLIFLGSKCGALINMLIKTCVILWSIFLQNFYLFFLKIYHNGATYIWRTRKSGFVFPPSESISFLQNPWILFPSWRALIFDPNLFWDGKLMIDYWFSEQLYCSVSFRVLEELSHAFCFTSFLSFIVELQQNSTCLLFLLNCSETVLT